VIARQWRIGKLAKTHAFCKRGKGFPAFVGRMPQPASVSTAVKTLMGTALEPKHERSGLGGARGTMLASAG